MPENLQFDAFLSHSAKDKAVVCAVAERLRKDGLKVWFDDWVLKAGDSIPAKIEEGAFLPSAFRLLPFLGAPIKDSMAQFVHVIEKLSKLDFHFEDVKYRSKQPDCEKPMVNTNRNDKPVAVAKPIECGFALFDFCHHVPSRA